MDYENDIASTKPTSYLLHAPTMLHATNRIKISRLQGRDRKKGPRETRERATDRNKD